MKPRFAVVAVAALALAPAALAKRNAADPSKQAIGHPELAPYPGGVRVKPRTESSSAQKAGHVQAATTGEALLAKSRNDGFATDDAPDKIAAHYGGALTKLGFTKNLDQALPDGGGRMLGFMKDAILVQVQIHTKRTLWVTYVADGEKPPDKANYVVVVSTKLY